MIQKREMTAVIITVIITKMLLVYPRRIILNSGQAAWLEVLYAAAIAFLLVILTFRVYRHKKSVIELAEICGGKGLRIAVGSLVFLLLLMNFSEVMRVFPESVKIILLQDSKTENITALFAVAAAAGAYMGIRSAARVNFMFLPAAAAVFAGFLLLLIPYYKITNITPVLGEGADKIFVSGFNSLSLFSDILILNVLLPRCENTDTAKRCLKKGMIISGAAAVLITAAFCLVYGCPSAREFILPMYQLSRIIHISSFFSRFEAFFQFVWSILILLYSVIYIAAMCDALKSAFRLKTSEPLIFPIVICAVLLSKVPSSAADVLGYGKALGLVEYPIVFILPILLGLAERRRKGSSDFGR